MVIQGVTYLSDFEAKKAIIEMARRLEAKGWLVAGDGSMRRYGRFTCWSSGKTYVTGVKKAYTGCKQEQLYCYIYQPAS